MSIERKMKEIRLLNVEDSEDDSTLLLRHLTRGGYKVYSQRVQTAEAMKKALANEDWDLIIADYQMPSFSGLMAFEVFKESGLDIPFIITSGTIGEETAVNAMVAGVSDYLMKGNFARLVPAVERELQDAAHRRARRQAELWLQESRVRLQLALSAAQMGVWEWNLKTNDVFWSPECYEITKAKDFKGTIEDFADLVHPDDVDEVMAKMKDTITHQKNYKSEFRIINSQGEIQWLANFGLTQYDENGEPSHLVGTVQDITERKESEAALRTSEEKFRALVQATSQYVWTADDQLRLDEVPLWWTDLTGQTIEEAQNWGWINAIHPEDRDPTKLAWEKSLKDGTPIFSLYRLQNREGEFRYFASRGIPVYNPDGSLRQWVGALNDITERKKSEEELRASEQRFRSLVSTTAQIVWTADSNGVVLAAHTPYGENVNVASENINQEWISRIHPDDKERVLTEFSKAIKNKRSYRSEYRILIKNNRYGHFIARGIPVFEKDGTVREWIGTLTDVTKRKITELELAKKEEQLRQSQKLESVGRLAGGIAHDFNNMLTVINGYSDLVLRNLTPDNPLFRKIQEIKTAGERAAELTNQLLAFSRQRILQTKKLNVNQIVSDTNVMLHRLIGEDIQIIEDLAPDLNQIEADSGQLSQIVMNLLLNSRDALPQGGKIIIKTENIYLDEEFVNLHLGSSVGNHILLKISDTGVGMDEEILSHIFDPFFTTKGVGHGTGLGLSTVYGIVKQFGGCIFVQSSPGEGTVTDIYLPSLTEFDKESNNQKGKKKFSPGSGTILLVEDERMIRKLSRQILEEAGYKVIEAENGVDAIAICNELEETIDLIITDVVMPKMGGRELAEKLSDVCSRVLFTSGYTDSDMTRHGITNSNFNFLQKPFSFEALIQKVQDLLEQEP